MSRPIVPKVRVTGTSVLLLGMFVGITACGGARATGGGSRDELRRDQIATLPNETAFTVIQRLRPRWIRPRIQSTISNPQPVYADVYVDQVRYGGIATLRDILSNDIERMEYLNARDATTLYGTGYMGGIIRVFTRR